MKYARTGKPFVRGGKVYVYLYREGKKTARDLVHLFQLTPSDLKKGAKRAFVAKVLAWAAINALTYRSE